MKNTDPPHHEHKAVPTITAKLTPELRKFIENVGMYFETFGIPRIGGRILGLLMIAHEPLSAEHIESILKVSRGSVSTNMRMLIGSGLAEKISPLGKRTSFFIYPESALERRTESGIQSGVAFKKLSEQGLAALPPDDIARHRFEETIEWSDVLIEAFGKVLVVWNDRHHLKQKSANLTGVPQRVANNLQRKN
jgi:predicted transcriptional regulator